MPGSFTVNEQHRVQLARVGHERNPVILIDDFLADPQGLIDAALAAPFAAPQNWYPGLRAQPLPQPYIVELIGKLHVLIGENFALPTQGGLDANAYFGLATTAPESLSVLQRLPHYDTANPRQVALLHYLCDAGHGGTSFYRHRSTGYESIGEARQKLYFDRLNQELAQSGPPPARYMSGDDERYEETARFEAKFNRLLIYRSSMLHSANVDPKTGLRADPRTGRLTANVFLAYK